MHTNQSLLPSTTPTSLIGAILALLFESRADAGALAAGADPLCALLPPACWVGTPAAPNPSGTSAVSSRALEVWLDAREVAMARFPADPYATDPVRLA